MTRRNFLADLRDELEAIAGSREVAELIEQKLRARFAGERTYWPRAQDPQKKTLLLGAAYAAGLPHREACAFAGVSVRHGHRLSRRRWSIR